MVVSDACPIDFASNIDRCVSALSCTASDRYPDKGQLFGVHDHAVPGDNHQVFVRHSFGDDHICHDFSNINDQPSRSESAEVSLCWHMSLRLRC